MNAMLSKLLSLPSVRSTARLLLAKRGDPLSLLLVFHSEMVQDEIVFKKLLTLGRSLSFRPVLCVMTPANPYIREDMAMKGVTVDEFTARLRELKKFYDIGLHGHWCRKAPSGIPPQLYAGKRATVIEKAGFSLTLKEPHEIQRQFREEYTFLSDACGAPRIYTAGWWYLNETVVRLLEEHHFLMDCSLRWGFKNSFEEETGYDTPLSPAGKPYYLNAARTIIELPGTFYVHMNWWTVVRYISGLLSDTGRPRFCNMPLHDYDLIQYADRLADTISFLTSISNIRFLSSEECLSAALHEVSR